MAKRLGPRIVKPPRVQMTPERRRALIHGRGQAGQRALEAVPAGITLAHCYRWLRYRAPEGAELYYGSLLDGGPIHLPPSDGSTPLDLKRLGVLSPGDSYRVVGAEEAVEVATPESSA